MDSALRHRGDYQQLRELRDLLDQRAFVPGLQDYIAARMNNRPGYVEGQITSLKRLAEELEASLSTDGTVTLGAGGTVSGGLVVGGILLAAAAPPLALVFAVCGIITGGVSYFGLKKIDREKLLCHQIVDALGAIEKAL